VLLYPFFKTNLLQIFAKYCIFIILYALKAICGISWKVEGIENIPEGPCIFAANHQGVWESFFLQTINIPTSSIIKRELLFIPFFGWALACLKPIHLRRSNKFKSLKTVIIKGSKKLSNNTSLIIFPEGTRSLPQNGLKNFSSSCGVLSVKNNVPVIPICHNSGLFWKNKRFNKEPGIIKVRIGPAIYGENPKNITKSVKNWIESNFIEIH
jgi:1-acyl-sn-glycerol-3-phosphate acyltransferase|tara:strand:+ start:815 stop:1447 length:633 start_codon:yes stop_codon:yes gene_type:complete